GRRQRQQVVPVRQNRHVLTRQQIGAAALLLQLLVPHVTVLGVGQAFSHRGIPDDDRSQEDHQIALLRAGRVVAKQPSQAGHVTEQRHLVLGLDHLVVNQSAEHDQLVVIHHHVGVEAALVGDQVGGAAGAGGDLGNLLGNFQANRVAFV